MGKIIDLKKSRPERSLENLNRLTGLGFERPPESLLVDGPVRSGPVAGAPAPRLSSRNPEVCRKHSGPTGLSSLR